jgi:hypothetical protein
MKRQFGRKGAIGTTNKSCVKETGNEEGRTSEVEAKVAPLTLGVLKWQAVIYLRKM